MGLHPAFADCGIIGMVAVCPQSPPRQTGLPMSRMAMCASVTVLLLALPVPVWSQDSTTDPNESASSGGTPGSLVQSAIARHHELIGARVIASRGGGLPGVLRVVARNVDLERAGHRIVVKAVQRAAAARELDGCRRAHGADTARSNAARSSPCTYKSTPSSRRRP